MYLEPLKICMDLEGIEKAPLKAAAANWVATAPIAAQLSSDCIMIDTGSTTTDIIPIKNGKECSKGRSDLERLKTGELVYTGTLRTNVAALVDKVPLGGEWVRVASELFALTADIHMDPWNFDQDRVRRCVIHYAVPDGRIIPFCSMNTLYREEIEKKFSKPLNKE